MQVGEWGGDFRVWQTYLQCKKVFQSICGEKNEVATYFAKVNYLILLRNIYYFATYFDYYNKVVV